MNLPATSWDARDKAFDPGEEDPLRVECVQAAGLVFRFPGGNFMDRGARKASVICCCAHGRIWI